MTLSKPYASLLDVIASLRGSAIPNKETVEQYGDLATHAVGTGPYKLAEYVPGDFVRYTRNPDYWDKGLPYIDEIVLKLMVDEDQRIAALRAGQIQMGSLSATGAQRLATETSFSVARSPKAAEEHILINSQKKPFDDARVRKAISMALDRNAFITKAVQGPAPSAQPTGFGDWFIPSEQLPYKQDIEGAKKLLADAGFGGGFSATIKATATFPEMSANAIELKNQLQAIGIKLDIVQMEWGELLKIINAGGPPDQIFDYDFCTAAYSFFADPDSYLGYFMPERNFFLRSSNTAAKAPEIAAALDKAQTILDHAERRKLYQDAEIKMLTEQVPALFLYAVDQIDGVSNSLKNYKQSFMGRRYLLKYASLGSAGRRLSPSPVRRGRGTAHPTAPSAQRSTGGTAPTRRSSRCASRPLPVDR